MSRTTILRAAREVVLTVGAVLGVLCLILTLAGMSLGLRPLIFRSGSMSPAIATGDLAVSRTVAASELQRGDIVSVLNGSGTRVTHRVVNVARQGDLRQLTLQGDANKQPDAEVYTVTEAQRVLFHVPRLGYVVGWFTGPVGIFLLGLYSALMLSVAFRRERSGGTSPPPGKPRRAQPGRRTQSRRRSQPGRRKMPALLAIAVGGGVTMWPTLAWATPWTDTASISGGTFTAGVVAPSATFTCGTLGVLSVRFNWTAVSGATSYTLHYGAGGASTTNIAAPAVTDTITSVISNGTAWVEANINYGGTTWTSVASTSRTYTVAGVSLCS